MGKRYERRRIWKLGKQTAFRCYSRTKQEIEKAENENQGLSTKKIQKILNCCDSFAGCFARDELSSLSLCSFPVYLIVNTDIRGKRGKHWITIRISKSHVELFDSLGLIHYNCLPTDILAFIQRFAISRTFIFNKPIQPRNSILCGFYSIFYVFVRQHCSFESIESFFSYKLSDNDAIIKSFFYTLNIFYSEYK